MTTTISPFVEPARRVPVKWGGYELRYALALAALVLGFVILIGVALPTDPADPIDRAIRGALLWLPSAGAIVSAILLPGRGEHRVLFGAVAAVGAGIPFFIMIAMPAPTKLGTVIIFALTAGSLVWAWMLGRDRPRLLQLLAPAAFVLTLVAAGLATELINGSGTLPVGWPWLFTPGTAVGTAADADLARESLTIWLAQLTVTVAIIVAAAWVGRLLAPRMRYLSPEERHDRAAAKLAAQRAGVAAKPDAAPEPPTNTMAILALVFSVLGGLLAIVFGFIALSQIKRTGERGRGLAIAALVITFAWVTPVVLFFVLGFAGVWNR